MLAVTVSLSVLVAASAAAPEQIHIAFGHTPDTMSVQWAVRDNATCSTPSTVQFGADAASLASEAAGACTPFNLSGQVRSSLHVASLTGLAASTTYTYRVAGASDAFAFTTAPDAATLAAALPQRFLVWGDLGSSRSPPAGTPTIMPWASGEVARGGVSMILHVGDFAYNFDSDGGEVGAAFMNDIQNMSSTTPYHVSVGNHEAANDYAHYTEFFRNMPTLTGSVTTDNGVAPNNWFYSHNVGLVHFVALSTEIPFAHPELAAAQRAWLAADLAAANMNRSAAPWVIAHGHRSLYCSCDGDCDESATALRREWEQLFYEHGVDLFINGHEHNYERMYDVAPAWDAASPWESGKTTRATVDMPATTYIVTGDAGNDENHEPFTRDAPARTALRTDAYGFSRMDVHNATHLHWQQVECDFSPDIDDIATGHRVIDDVWLVQHQHGSFSERAARDARPVA